MSRGIAFYESYFGNVAARQGRYQEDPQGMQGGENELLHAQANKDAILFNLAAVVGKQVRPKSQLAGLDRKGDAGGRIMSRVVLCMREPRYC